MPRVPMPMTILGTPISCMSWQSRKLSVASLTRVAILMMSPPLPRRSWRKGAQVLGGLHEIVIRHDDFGAHAVAEPPDGVVLDVDVLRAELHGLAKRHDPLRLAAGEEAALARRAVGDYDGAGAAVEKHRQVGPLARGSRAAARLCPPCGRQAQAAPLPGRWWSRLSARRSFVLSRCMVCVSRVLPAIGQRGQGLRCRIIADRRRAIYAAGAARRAPANRHLPAPQSDGLGSAGASRPFFAAAARLAALRYAWALASMMSVEEALPEYLMPPNSAVSDHLAERVLAAR